MSIETVFLGIPAIYGIVDQHYRKEKDESSCYGLLFGGLKGCNILAHSSFGMLVEKDQGGVIMPRRDIFEKVIKLKQFEDISSKFIGFFTTGEFLSAKAVKRIHKQKNITTMVQVKVDMDAFERGELSLSGQVSAAIPKEESEAYDFIVSDVTVEISSSETDRVVLGAIGMAMDSEDGYTLGSPAETIATSQSHAKAQAAAMKAYVDEVISGKREATMEVANAILAFTQARGSKATLMDPALKDVLEQMRVVGH
ncbi:hypothetical protein J8273_4181 [Carpediemonas membranifera]|uniref:Uncharacterized protein n=1 Tax=Carpediemonas membranifera TaxID=201153 RepID=A0A8J6E4I5_9EUKA|nr:hypothetical protein J8273_4181 [Carpediemonas membranifera]|eukprot:KAG9394507.1 hypothetical protein J8273_4181 [Carpediemonas membranifera]